MVNMAIVVMMILIIAMIKITIVLRMEQEP